jgi:hypothetical protein
MKLLVASLIVAGAAGSAGAVALVGQASADREFTRTFALATCTFSTTGRVPYLVLEPGHTLVLQNKKGGRLTVTVTDRTENVGGVATRVVEEHEENGKLVEVSHNYLAICAENRSVFYFGEAVDNYRDGRIVDHEGAWRHGTDGATAGLMMPALPLLGARYYQEIAPRVAMDRAEIVAVASTLQTPYGALADVLLTRETTPLEPGVQETKAHAPGIGLVRDEDMLLVSVTKAPHARRPSSPRRHAGMVSYQPAYGVSIAMRRL